MSTRSFIIIHDEAAGILRGIYTHWDGYPEGVGRTLVEHYSDAAAAAELVSMGACSVLSANIGDAHEFGVSSVLANYAPHWSTFYHRDRGDEWEHCMPQVSNGVAGMLSLAEDSWCEYAYFLLDGHWVFREIPSPVADETDGWQIVAEYLARPDAEQAEYAD